jgi:hypothetical protein
MTDLVSTWPVVLELPLGGDDRDDEGVLLDGAVERLFAEARGAYAEVCPELDLSDAAVSEIVVRRGAAAEGEVAVVGIAVVEVFPTTFTMDLRVRPAEGPGIAATGSCVVAPAGGVSDALRRRLIDLAQTARHHP